MRLCRKILAISFKEKSIFRFDYIVGTVFAFLYIVLKVYLWKGLYGTGGKAIGGICEYMLHTQGPRTAVA